MDDLDQHAFNVWILAELDRIIEDDDEERFMELFGIYDDDEISIESETTTVVIDVCEVVYDSEDENDLTKIDRVN